MKNVSSYSLMVMTPLEVKSIPKFHPKQYFQVK